MESLECTCKGHCTHETQGLCLCICHCPEKASPKLQSISEWLSELDGHSIYDSAKLKTDFEKHTGQKAPDWPEYTPQQTRATMQARGLGGTHNNPTGAKECWGYTLAAHLASKLANYSSPAMGRGRSFWDCVSAIKKAGL
jgi:hypothetical protein